jgi:hypothetical protein
VIVKAPEYVRLWMETSLEGGIKSVGIKGLARYQFRPTWFFYKVLHRRAGFRQTPRRQKQRGF